MFIGKRKMAPQFSLFCFGSLGLQTGRGDVGDGHWRSRGVLCTLCKQVCCVLIFCTILKPGNGHMEGHGSRGQTDVPVKRIWFVVASSHSLRAVPEYS